MSINVIGYSSEKTKIKNINIRNTCNTNINLIKNLLKMKMVKDLSFVIPKNVVFPSYKVID